MGQTLNLLPMVLDPVDDFLHALDKGDLWPPAQFPFGLAAIQPVPSILSQSLTDGAGDLLEIPIHPFADQAHDISHRLVTRHCEMIGARIASIQRQQ